MKYFYKYVLVFYICVANDQSDQQPKREESKTDSGALYVFRN